MKKFSLFISLLVATAITVYVLATRETLPSVESVRQELNRSKDTPNISSPLVPSSASKPTAQNMVGAHSSTTPKAETKSADCEALRALETALSLYSEQNAFPHLRALFQALEDPNPEQLALYFDRHTMLDNYASIHVMEEHLVNRHPYHDYDESTLQTLSQQGDAFAPMLLARRFLFNQVYVESAPMGEEAFRQTKEMLYTSIQRGNRAALSLVLELYGSQTNDHTPTEIKSVRAIELAAIKNIIQESGDINAYFRTLGDDSFYLKHRDTKAVTQVLEKQKMLNQRFALPPLPEEEQRIRAHVLRATEILNTKGVSGECSD